jgi:hypothetical protein
VCQTLPSRMALVLLLPVVVIPAGGRRAAVGNDDPQPLVTVGDFKVEEDRGRRRLLHNDILWASQFPRPYLLSLDAPIPFGSYSPWEVLLLEGSLAAWDPMQEPLTYYHRAGPVGAIFYQLHTRKGGADAKTPVGVVGLTGGTTACYALPGQKITYYETHPELKKLVADTDRYLTYIGDARRRGADVEIRIGNARKKLVADTDRKFGVLLVELYDTEFDPGERLTLEAVRLYADRVTPDGIVALHISNKVLRLEPIVAAIAAELKLTGRVWYDDYTGLPGKTASTWVILARDEKHLGVLAKPMIDQVLAFGTRNVALATLIRKYGPKASAKGAIEKEWGGTDLVMEDFLRLHGHVAATLLQHVRRAEAMQRRVTLGDLTEIVYGEMFRPLKAEEGVGVRHDGDKKWPAAVINENPLLRKLFK